MSEPTNSTAGAGLTSVRATSSVVAIGACYSIAAGLGALVGWWADLPRLTDWNVEGIAMFANTAVSAVLAGASLLLLLRKDVAWRQVAGRVAASVVAAIGGLTLFEHLTGVNLGIDTILVSRPWGQRAATAPMRMGPPAAIAFLTLGIALWLATLGFQARRTASHLGMVLVLIGALSLTGYWYGANQLFGVAQFTGIAFQTSTIVVALGVALIASIPEQSTVALLRRRDAGGRAFRELLAPVIIIPLLLGWLRIVGGQMRLYDVAFGAALRSLVEVLLLFLLLWWTSTRISRQAAKANEAQVRLSALVESSDDAIVSKTLEGVILSWNAGAERVFGFTAEEAVGQHITLIIPQDRTDEETQILAKLRRGDRIEHYETVRMRKGGELRNISLSVSPIRNADGTIIAASKIARDITDRIQAEEALRHGEDELRALAEERSQLLEAERAARAEAERASVMKDEFLATLSHELRTPLSAIVGWSQVLQMEKITPADLRDGVDAIARNARMQAQLIDDLLDMSRIVSGKIRLDIQQIDLPGVVDAAVESVRPSAEAKQIRLRKIIDPHAEPVSGDPARMQQVIWNLLTNAIKFTPKSGTVDVLLERVNSHVEITVRDSGIGIKPEFLPLVFERFRQADSTTTRYHGGLGIGLSIVKTLVELHGGTVRVKSAGEGQGSSFFVNLPLTPVRRDQSQEHPKALKQPAIDCDGIRLSGIKVLVVDDDADARELIKRVLGRCEAEVTTADSAKEALQLLHQERPHVIVSDIGMPGTDGYQFIKEVRALSSEAGGKTPAVALTAFARSEDRTRALLAGYQVHLSKPIEPQELLVTVGSVVGRTSPD